MSDYVDTVDIEGTQYDIQDTATKQTADQNTQDIEDLLEGSDYSTTEIKTGAKWLDGRPIYKNTITGTTGSQYTTFPGNANSKEFQINAPINEIVKSYGYLLPLNNPTPIPLSGILSSSSFSTYWFRNNNHPTYPNTLSIAVGSSYINTPFYLTVFYTKSTDSPQP